MLRVWNCTTAALVTEFSAHEDFLRGVDVHPTTSLVLTCSDDHSIKVWDWEKDWSMVCQCRGHTHYVMAVKFNPSNPSTFASGSLDNTINMWSVLTGALLHTFKGHERGVNCIEFHPGDKPYLFSGGDDNTVRVWDYETRTMVKVLDDGHTDNVDSVAVHPRMPVLVSGAEDRTLRFYQSNTFTYECELATELGRVWTCAASKHGEHMIAVGCDEVGALDHSFLSLSLLRVCVSLVGVLCNILATAAVPPSPAGNPDPRH